MVLPHRWLTPPSYGDGDNIWGGQVDYARYGDGRVPIRELFVNNYNARFFGARGDGLTNDQPALFAALDYIRTHGGGALELPAGNYLFTSYAVHPLDGVLVCLIQGANTVIWSRAGAVLKLGANMPNQLYMITNYNRTTGTRGDTDMWLDGVTLDGNAGAQSGSVDAQYGCMYRYARRVGYQNVLARDVFGTTNGGNGPNGMPGEGSMLMANFCTDVTYQRCEIYDSGVNKTALGYSTNFCNAVALVSCKGYNTKFSRIFSHYHSRGVVYTGCHAYLAQTDHGFNSENSQDVVYEGCMSGGQANDTDSFPYPANQSLGNAGCGFFAKNGSQHKYIGCVGSNNTLNGLNVITAAGGGWQVMGGEYDNNSQRGIAFDNSTGWTSFPSPRLSGNTVAAASVNGAIDTPLQGQMTAPAVPATTVGLPSPYPVAAQVTVAGGTVSQIQIGGVTVATATPYTGVVPPNGQQIKLTYTVAPTWSWVSIE